MDEKKTRAMVQGGEKSESLRLEDKAVKDNEKRKRKDR